ncbi:EamA family transporter [Pontiella agarivorans]|uniref:EamA family transporter n=1 Tax=Pontiella agarivorans TaxID=3038953 RepID=A0ABU5MZB9_9BACT|nr:EamA family transporter [Pontiella agarivorans]MDZ8119518.1 EamA family transporter [Pontiella agarivorans]
MWIWLGLCSMLLLGFYDLSKKHALTDNAVLPTLFFSNLAGACMVVPIILISLWLPEAAQRTGLYAAPLTPGGHGLLVLKSMIVGSSWICAFFAMKHLPISMVSPIRASGPLWTLLGAVVLFGEMPSPMQWVGMILIFAGYFGFSVLGRAEGIHFHRSLWVGLIFAATLIGTCSTLMDKWLIQRMDFEPMQVLVWYSLYNFIFFTIVNAVFWFPKRKSTTPFRWRWTVPMIGILLVLSDWVYFMAVENPEALIVILSVLRRCSVLVGFFVGALIFKEVNKRKKSWVLAGIMVGVLLIILAG